jgi:3-oxoacyl-[acyl-carrier-protein] synthase III
MHSIGIRGYEARLGERFVALLDLVSDPARFQEFPGAWVTEDIQSLLLKAAANVLEANQLSGNEIDCLFWVSAIPENHLRQSQTGQRSFLSNFCYSGSWLQSELGLRRAAVVGVAQQGCAGFFSAIRMANNLIAAELDVNHVLLVGGDALTPGTSREVLFNIVSDAACAVIVSREKCRYRFVAGHQIAKGSFWDVCSKPAEIAASYFPSAKTVVQTLRKKLGDDGIDLVISSGIRRSSWEILMNLWGIPIDRCVFPRTSFGHTIQADSFLILKEAEAGGLIRLGMRILLFTFGFGSTWSAIVLEATG